MFTKMAAPLAIAGLLVACGGGDEASSEGAMKSSGEVMLDNGMTVAAAIDARQQGYKKIGRNFKAINDQLRSGDPDVSVIVASAETISDLSSDVPNWFPDGTGAASGVETDALPVIWTQPDDFASKAEDFQTAAMALLTASEQGDVASIQSAARSLGGTCKACHDSYRKDDD